MLFGDELKKTIAAVLIVCCSTTAMSHGGGTNSDGCHNDNKNGGYHCHGGGSSGGGSSDDSSSASGIVGGIAAGLLILYIFKKYREKKELARYNTYRDNNTSHTNYQYTGSSLYGENYYWRKYDADGTFQTSQVEENQGANNSTIDNNQPNLDAFGCSQVKSCNELTSCEEVRFHLNTCKSPNIDELCESKICKSRIR